MGRKENLRTTGGRQTDYSRKPCRTVCRKLLSGDRVFIVITVIISGFALAGVTIYFNLDKTTVFRLAPMDSRVITMDDTLNFFFCERLTFKSIEWHDEQPLFNAYLFHKIPQPSSHEYYRVGIRKQRKRGAYFRKSFHLLNDSLVSFEPDKGYCVNITICEGYKNYKPSEMNKKRNTCQNKEYARLQINDSYKRMPVKFNKSDGYVFEFSNCNESDAIDISLIVSFTKPTYNKSSSVQNCSDAEECSFEHVFNKKRFILVHMKEAENSYFTGIRSSCEHRVYAYVVLFGFIPVIISMLLIIVACWCDESGKNQHGSEQLLSVSWNEPRNYGSSNQSFLDSGESYESASSEGSSESFYQSLLHT